MVNTATNSGKVAFAAALAAVAMGGTVLSGWIFALDDLQRIVPGLEAMNTATAAAFILAGISLALFLRSPRGEDRRARALRMTARLCASVVTAIGLFKVVGFLCAWNFTIGRWLFGLNPPEGLQFVYRMSPNAALYFLLLGNALLFVNVRKRSVRFIVELSAVVVGLGSLASILGYAYGIRSSDHLGPFVPMGLHTAVTFFVLSIAVLLSHTDRGLLATFAGASAGGKLAQRLLPAVILVPALLGWLSRLGEETGFPVAFCKVAEAVGNIVVFTGLVCWTAQRLFNAGVRRRLAEEATRESEKRFVVAFEHAPIGVAFLSPAGRWLKVNRAFCDMVGYSEADLLTRTCHDITHPDDIERCLRNLHELVLGKTRIYRSEKRYVHASGRPVTVSFNVSLVRDGLGQPNYLIAQIQDITERERAEVVLLESKRFLQATLDSLSSHIAILDEHGTILEVNAAWNRFGDQTCFKGGRRVVGDNYLESCDESAADSAEDAAALAGGIRAVTEGQRDEFQLEYPCHSLQEQRWFLIRVTRFGGDGPVRVVVARENVTARKKGEEEVRFNEQRYRSLVEATAAIVWTTDATGRFEVEQPGWTAFTGQRSKEHLGWGWLKAVHPDDQTETGRAWSAAVATRSIYEVEHRVRARDGIYRVMTVRAVPILAADGTVHQWIGVHTDITERKRAEADLRWKTAFLEAQVDSSLDGILVVDGHGKKLLQNQRFTDLLKIPQHIADDTDDEKQVVWVTGMTKDPAAFILRVAYLKSHPDEISRDEIELMEGTFLDRYSAPVIGSDGTYFGRIWTFRDLTERKRNEESLRLLGSAVEQSRESILITDAELDLPGPRIVFVNPAFTRMFGYTAEEVIGKTPRLFQGPRTDREVLDRLRRNLAAGEAFEGETTNYRKDGSPFVLAWQITPIREGTGPVTHFVAIERDITEQTRSATLLRESQQRLALATESAHLGIWDWNVVENDMVWDAQMVALYGLRPQDFTGAVDAWQNGLHREDRARAEAEVAAALAGTHDFRSEFRVVWPGGEVRDIQAHGVVQRAADGSPTRMIGVNWDITARKRTEARYRRLVESNMQGILFWTATGGITGANDALLRLIGYSREDLEAGRIDWVTMTPPEHAHLDQRALEDIAARGASALYEKEFIRKDGTRAPILLGATAFEDNPNEGVCFVVDLTDRKRLETQLVQSQKLETVGKLAGGIAHEFNSILTAIIGQSELLLADLPSGSPLTTNATEITKAAGRAAALTRQLLAYGRKQLLQPEALDLNRVITRMEGMLRHLMGGEIDMRIVATPGLHAVKADAGQLEQVIMQVAINARDAMPNGGKFTLETANVSFDQESVSNYPELKPGDYVMLAITDNGQGMSPEVKARAFEPFFSTKGVGEGTGLGLSTCYGIVKQSGGHISVYSELARGATFKIYLPQVEQFKAVSVRRAAPTDLPRGTETILLVEDDPALREMASALLRRLGYTVLAAANGIEALSLKQQRGTGHVDLLFTDVVMPHMSGKELADRVRTLYPHTKILYTSAYTENAIAHQDVLGKGVALLQKPFMPSALARKVREVLDQPGEAVSGD